jgi:hypothetical protein
MMVAIKILAEISRLIIYLVSVSFLVLGDVERAIYFLITTLLLEVMYKERYSL